MSRVLARRSPWTLVAALATLFVALYPVFSSSLYYQNMIILSLIFAIGASGLNVIAGYGGYVSLGQSAFLGLGAYTVGLLSLHHPDVSPFVWVPLAGVVSAIFAAALGVIAMRTRGHAFVIITIAFLFLTQLVVLNWRAFTKGSSGISLPIPRWDLAYQNWPFYYSLLALLGVSMLTSWWIRRTKFGMGLAAMREDEDKAATIGVSTPAYKILGFVVSAVFLGMAGGIFGYYLSFIDPRGMFDIVISVQIILSVLLGGRGTLWGPVLGAFIIEPLNELANQQLGGGNSRLLIFGGLMTLVVLFLPRGIIPSVGEWLTARRRRGQPAPTGTRADAAIAISQREAPVHPQVVAGGDPLLEVSGLQKRFGGVRAVDGCSFSVAPGSITALIGPNGSGKTTAFNLIDGTMRADAGTVLFDGHRIEGMAPWRRAHLGIARTFQITRLFGAMTVLENVVAPLRSFSLRQLNAVAMSGPEAQRGEELLEFAGLAQYRDQPARTLSYGQQKLVEFVQVLMLDPKLVLLDEPAGGINPTVIERMSQMIRELHHQGLTFLVVEHNMPFVLGLCDPVVVLARGDTISHGTPDHIQRDPKVLDAYLGEDFVLDEPVGAPS